MDLSELQNKWSEMNNRLSSLENTIEHDKMDKMKTAQEKLAHQYRMFVIMAAIFIFVSLVSWTKLFGPVMGILFAAFFLLVMIMDFTLMKKVSRIDFAQMSLVEVAESARKCRKFHHVCQLILIPIAILLLGSLCYKQTSDENFLWGCACGAVLGIGMGLAAYSRFMKNYKKLIQ